MPEESRTPPCHRSPGPEGLRCPAAESQPPALHDAGIGQAPQSPEALHQFLIGLDIRIPRSAVVPGHDAPFQYLCHTFFEGRGTWQDGDKRRRSPAREERPDGPIDCIVWANRGGGKTFLGAVATMLDLVFKPGVEVRILAGSLEQASRMHDHLRALFAHPRLGGLVEGRITERRLRLACGSGCELLAQSQASVRGTRVQKLRCDEVELFDPAVWEAAQLTTRGRRCGGLWVRGAVECLSTMHVPYGIMARLVKEAGRGRRRLFKWGLIDVLEKCGEEYVCRGIGFPADAAPGAAPQSGPGSVSGASASPGKAMPRPMPILNQTADCPLLPECQERAKRTDDSDPGHITIEDALTQKARVGAATWEAEMLCRRPQRSDTVLPDFDPAAHVVASLPWEADGPRWREPAPAAWVAGMDFGYRGLAVVLWAGVDEAGRVFIADERAASGEILAAHIDAILAGRGRAGPWPRPQWIGIDPAGQSANSQTGAPDAQVMAEAGLSTRARRMSVEQGLSLIRARLKPADGPARLFIHERCTTLIESMEKYHYPADRPQSLTPVKDGHDHAVDALRYLMMNLDRPYRTERGRY